MCSMALSLMLKSLGHKSDVVNNGKKAIEQILDRQRKSVLPEDNYKLIFMDCNMPMMNGYTACLKLKKEISAGRISDLKIIACTADTTNRNVEKCGNFKFDLILFKPVQKESLSKVLLEYSELMNQS